MVTKQLIFSRSKAISLPEYRNVSLKCRFLFQLVLEGRLGKDNRIISKIRQNEEIS